MKYHKIKLDQICTIIDEISEEKLEVLKENLEMFIQNSEQETSIKEFLEAVINLSNHQEYDNIFTEVKETTGIDARQLVGMNSGSEGEKKHNEREEEQD